MQTNSLLQLLTRVEEHFQSITGECESFLSSDVCWRDKMAARSRFHMAEAINAQQQR